MPIPFTFTRRVPNFLPNDPLLAAEANRYEQLGEDAAELSRRAVLQPAWVSNGLTDDAPAIQAFYDAGGGVVIGNGGTMLLNSPLFFDKPSVTHQIMFIGVKFKLGNSLPTTTWSASASCRFAMFFGTLRGAISGNVVTVNDGSRATGSGGALRPVIFIGCEVDGQGAEVGFGYSNRSPASHYGTIFHRLRVGHTRWDYGDTDLFDGTYFRGGGPTGQVMYEQVGNGDGATFRGTKCDSDADLARLLTCNGAHFSGVVTGRVKMVRCSNIVFTGVHQEGQQNAAGRIMLEMEDSQANAYGSVFYGNYDATNAPIVIADSPSLETDSKLRLHGCQFVLLETGSTGQQPISPMINITSIGRNTQIIVRDQDSAMASTSMSGQRPPIPMPKLLGPAEVMAAINTPQARRAMASGNWMLRRTQPSTWKITDPTGLEWSERQPQQPAIAQVSTTSGVVAGGSLPVSQQCQYTICVEDGFGNLSQAATPVAGTTNTNRVLRLLLNLGLAPATVHIWRNFGSSVLTAPTAYARLEVNDAQAYVYDTGYRIGLVPWSTTGIPAVPGTGSGSNLTVTGIQIGAGRLFDDGTGAIRGRGGSGTVTTIAPA